MAKRSTNGTPVHWEEQMSAFGGHPLHLHVAPLRAATAGGEAEAGAGLAELGITDAEQLVALANRDETRNHLAATLKVSKQALDTLVKEAKKALPAPLVTQLEHPLPPVFPLGAVEPPEGVPAPEESAAGLAE